jgi:hypothetical protein
MLWKSKSKSIKIWKLVKNEINHHYRMTKIHALEEQIKIIENWKLALAEIIRESPFIE